MYIIYRRRDFNGGRDAKTTSRGGGQASVPTGVPRVFILCGAGPRAGGFDGIHAVAFARGCDAPKTCGQITSCDEAKFYVQICGLSRLDGDGDGAPCETLCR
jgi:hypothetical protein